ncbi:MAG: Fur family transcriptional regulator [Alphaproteobacteria bacterium]|nr:Fur family transcriptional regulator [Alphaproteobacteria bacterium]
MASRLEKKCKECGLKMTGPRKVILRVLSKSGDHPDVEQLCRRVRKCDPGIGVATVYRTVRLFEEKGIVNKHTFGDGRARFEETGGEHHDHLIDLKSGKIIEFTSREIEKLQEAIARKHGYKLVGHKLDLYCVLRKKK